MMVTRRPGTHVFGIANMKLPYQLSIAVKGTAMVITGTGN